MSRNTNTNDVVLSDAVSTHASSDGTESIDQARARILAAVQAGMVRRRRVRRATNAASVVCVLSLVGVATWFGTAGLRSEGAREVASSEAIGPNKTTEFVVNDRPTEPTRVVPAATPVRLTSIRVVEPPRETTIVRAGGSTGAFSTSGTSRIVREVSDEELVRVLASSGRDVGIVRVGDAADVVCNSCDTDESWLSPIDGASVPVRRNQ